MQEQSEQTGGVMTQRKPKVTWTWLTAEEPALLRLEKDIRAVRDDGGPSFCANRQWYGRRDDGFKIRLYYLAGFMARNERLRTMEAYDVATKRLYALLPNCRNCICM
jgi:hypothetical protein